MGWTDSVTGYLTGKTQLNAVQDLFSPGSNTPANLSNFNKQQQGLWNTYSDWLSKQSTTQTPYAASTPWSPGDTFQWAAPTNTAQNNAAQLANVMSGNTPSWLSDAARNAVQGMTMQQAQDMYMKNVNPAIQRNLQQNVLPNIDENFVGAGALSSLDRARLRSNAQIDTANQTGQGIADWSKFAMQNAQQGLGLATSLMQAGFSAQQAVGAMQQAQQQNEINARFQEYLRTQPGAASNPIINRIMEALGMSTQSVYNQQTPPGIGASLLQGSGTAAGGLAALLKV